MRWALLLLALAVLAGCVTGNRPRQYILPPETATPLWERAASVAWERLGDMAPFLGGTDVSRRPRLVVVDVDCLSRRGGCVTASRGDGVVMVASMGRRPSDSDLARQLCQVAARDPSACDAVAPELVRELAAAGY